MIGKKFGRLTVESGPIHKSRRYWLCKCDCGNEKLILVRQDLLYGGLIKSCGCYHRETTSKISKTHGMSGTRIYRIWRGMRNRCENQNIPQYRDWGGREIIVCEEWKTDFNKFYEWVMSNGYSENLSIDRIDNDGDYCPENCRWTTSKEQALNRKSNSFITHNGVTKHISEWDKDIGSKKSGRVRARLNAGWSIEDAVTTPVWASQVMRGRKR